MNQPLHSSQPSGLRVFSALLLSFLLIMMPFAQMAARAGVAEGRSQKAEVRKQDSSSSAAADNLFVNGPIPEPAPAPPVGSVTATMAAAITTDADSDTKADPGVDTITYTATITNNTGADVSGLQFNDTVDTHTTLVAGSSVAAADDKYNTIGNVQISIPDGNTDLLTNDFDPETGNNTGMTATAETKSSTNCTGGCSNNVTINADGSFTYDPPVDFTGTDTFTYTAHSGSNTATATVRITVSGAIWFVNDNAGACTSNCDGRLSHPFTTLSAFNTANDGAAGHPSDGDTIFLYESATNYTGPVTLRANQKFIGQDATATLLSITGLSAPSGTDPLPAMNSGNGTIVNITVQGITLGSGNTLRGFTVGDVGVTTKISGTSFGTLVVGNNSSPDVTLNGTGSALNLTTGTLSVSGGFVSVTSTSTSGAGISLTGVADSDGAGGSAFSFGSTTISNFNTCVSVSTTTADVNFGNTSCTVSGTNGINLLNNSAGTRTFGTLTVSGITSTAFSHASAGGKVNITGAANLTAAGNAISVSAPANGDLIDFQAATSATTTSNAGAPTAVNWAGAAGATMQFNSLSITRNGGIALNASGGGTITVTNGTGSITNTTDGGPAIVANGIALNANFSAINSSSSGVVGTNCVSLTNVTGTSNFGTGALSGASSATFLVSGGTASVTYSGGITQANNAAMVSVAGGHSGTITFNTGTLNASNGTGLQFDNADGTYNFNGTTTLNGGDAGIDILNGSGGTFSFGGTTITNPTGVALNVDSSTGGITISGTISKTSSGKLINFNNYDTGTATISGNLSCTTSCTGVQVSNDGTASGTVTFSGGTKTINTGTNTAVNLDNNDGGTVNFNGGGLAITTTSGVGFNAINGGTVNVTTGGNDNTVSTTTGTGVNIVTPTNIGGSGVTFKSITVNNGASNSATNAIVLNGTTGSFTVSGDGSTGSGMCGGGTNATAGLLDCDGSGGTINKTTGISVLLTNASNVTLRQMNITSPALDGIKATGGGGITLSAIFVNSPGASNPAAGGDGFGQGNGFRAENITGTTAVNNNTRVTNWQSSQSNAILLHNTNTNFTSFSFNDSKIDTSATGAAGFHANLNGTTAGTVNLINNEFTLIDQNAAQILNNGSGTITSIVQKNNFHDADATGGDGNNTFFLANDGSGQANFTIGGPNASDGNTFKNLARLIVLAGVLQVDCAGTGTNGAKLNGSIQHNSISNDVGFSNGRRAIDVQIEADGAIAQGGHSVLIANNTINNVDKQGINLTMVTTTGGDIQNNNFSIKNNTLTNVGTEGNVDSGSGIEIETNIDLANQSSNLSSNILVQGNSVQNSNTSAVGSTFEVNNRTTGGNNTSVMNLTVKGNTFTNNAAGETVEILNSGGDGTAAPVTCLDLNGQNIGADINTSVGGNGTGFKVTNNALGTYSIEGMSGNQTAAAVQTFLAARNTGGVTAAINAPATTFVGSAGCTDSTALLHLDEKIQRDTLARMYRDPVKSALGSIFDVSWTMTNGPTITAGANAQPLLATAAGSVTVGGSKVRSETGILDRLAASLWHFATSVDSLIEPTAYAETAGAGEPQSGAMFIAPTLRNDSQLRRSEISASVGTNMPLLQSAENNLGQRFYKHSVPTGLRLNHVRNTKGSNPRVSKGVASAPSLTVGTHSKLATRAVTLTPVVGCSPGGINGGGTAICVDIPTLKAGDSVQITFQVTVNNPPNLDAADLSGGSHVSNSGTVTGTFTGSPVTSTAVNTTVDLFDSATTLVNSSGNNPSNGGDPVTFTATVAISGSQSPTPPSPVTPTGTVTFFDGVNPITCTQGGTAQTLNGSAQAVCTTSSLTAGSTHSITAQYSGDGNYDPSTSNTVSQQVFACTAAPVVTKIADTNDGVCDGDCSLREAIATACTGATITFDTAGVFSTPQTITLGGTELSVARNVTINSPAAAGNHVTVSGNNASRVFNINSGKTVSISNLTISGGKVTGANNGGGVLNSGTLTLTNVTLSGNSSDSIGGGIFNSGNLTMTSSFVSGNTGKNGGGGIEQNNSSAVAMLTTSTVSGNNAPNGGGAGVENSSGTFTINGVTVTGNSSLNTGGGIYNGDTMVLYNSTISGNFSKDNGGGMENDFTATIVNCTITNNHADNDDTAGGTGGGIRLEGNPLTLRNTIVAGNFRGSGTGVPDDLQGGTSVDAANCTNNLIGTGGSGGLTNLVNGNQVGVADAKLGPLQNNGGPTFTHALLATSPAIEAGSNTAATNAGLTTDQRGTGFPRIADSADSGTTATVDIGAFEVHPSIEDIADTSTNEDTQKMVTFNIGDDVSSGGTLISSVTATSSNTTLVTSDNAHLAISGSGGSRTLTITPNTNANSANSGGDTTITVTVTATNGRTATDTFVLSVTAVNDAPQVTTTGGSLAYTENAAATAIDSGITVTDIDSANLVAATVAITSGFAASQDTLAFTNQLGITGNYNSGTGVLTLTGTTTVANYQTALRAVTYQNSSDNPTASRTVTFTVDDGGGVNNTGSGTRNITISAVNDAPVNTVPGPQATSQNTPLVFSTGNGNLISVADADAGSNAIKVTLTATNGTLTLSGTAGLDFNGGTCSGAAGDGTADATMTFCGTLTNVNTALNGMSFAPTSGFSGGATLTITTNDQGNTGSGGALSDTDSVNITVASNVSIQDGSVAEPASGTTNMLFTVSLSAPAGAGGASVQYAMADQAPALGHAVGGVACNGTTVDYVNSSGTINFATGEQVKTVAVAVCSDNNAAEPNETFLVNLSSPTNVTIADGQAVGTITNTNPAGNLLVSELRTSGPAGSTDEFVELYNNTDSPLDASGYGVFKIGSDCNATPVLIAALPGALGSNTTVIPARGHYLLTGAAYDTGSLNSYAAKDQSLLSDIESDRNVGVFSTSNVASISSANRLDAVGFGTNTGANCSLLSEGTNLPAASGSALEYSFFRKLASSTPQDTNNNSADFMFADTQGTATPMGQQLGAPGPENKNSPIQRNATVAVFLLDNTIASSGAPNRVRNSTPNTPNATVGPFGTLTFNRRIQNNTGAPVTRLRFRIVNVTTFPPGPGDADLRAITSSDVSVSNVHDTTTCVDRTAGTASNCTVTVRGTLLEQPPNQSIGGGYNSTMSVNLSALPGGNLPNLQSVEVQFQVGVRTTGHFKFLVIVEALP